MQCGRYYSKSSLKEYCTSLLDCSCTSRYDLISVLRMVPFAIAKAIGRHVGLKVTNVVGWTVLPTEGPIVLTLYFCGCDLVIGENRTQL